MNTKALATSVLARSRNASLSAYAYRVSLILFESGASYHDRVRLNRLGICMSPESVVNLQKGMGLSTDTKVLSWKEFGGKPLRPKFYQRSKNSSNPPRR